MKSSAIILKLALAIALLLGTFALPAPADAKCHPPEFCTDIYAPVICDDGVIYSNQCYADAACAKHCKTYVWWE